MNRFESAYKPIKKYLAPGLLAIAALLGGATQAWAQVALGAAAADAQADLASAYNAKQQGNCTSFTTLAGVTLAPGFYCIDDVAKTGTLTLSGGPDDVWIFKTVQSAAGDLTGTKFSVAMEGGAQPCNVFWAPVAAVTMTDSTLKGNILAGNPTPNVGSITLTRGTLAGRALASGAVTITGTTVIGTLTGNPPNGEECKKSKKSKKSEKSTRDLNPFGPND